MVKMWHTFCDVFTDLNLNDTCLWLEFGEATLHRYHRLSVCLLHEDILERGVEDEGIRKWYCLKAGSNPFIVFINDVITLVKFEQISILAWCYFLPNISLTLALRDDSDAICHTLNTLNGGLPKLSFSPFLQTHNLYPPTPVDRGWDQRAWLAVISAPHWLNRAIIEVFYKTQRLVLAKRFKVSIWQ